MTGSPSSDGCDFDLHRANGELALDGELIRGEESKIEDYRQRRSQDEADEAQENRRGAASVAGSVRTGAAAATRSILSRISFAATGPAAATGRSQPTLTGARRVPQWLPTGATSSSLRSGALSSRIFSEAYSRAPAQSARIEGCRSEGR